MERVSRQTLRFRPGDQHVTNAATDQSARPLSILTRSHDQSHYLSVFFHKDEWKAGRFDACV
jgi:hypothetical protein